MAYETRGVPFEYKDVRNDKAALAEMLRYSAGRQLVPVIVDGGRVEVGYAGGS